MDFDRRVLLKAMSAAGLALTATGWANARSFANVVQAGGRPAGLPFSNVTPILTGEAYEENFIAGVKAAAESRGAQMNQALHLRELNSVGIAKLGAFMNQKESGTLLGLTNDASAALILDLVRSAGGRVLASSHHRIADDLTAPSRVRLIGGQLVFHCCVDAATLDTMTPGRSYVAICCTL